MALTYNDIVEMIVSCRKDDLAEAVFKCNPEYWAEVQKISQNGGHHPFPDKFSSSPDPKMMGYPVKVSTSFEGLTFGPFEDDK